MADEKKLSSVVSSTQAIQHRQLQDGTQQEVLLSHPPEQHPVYALVGRIAAQWSLYEHTLDTVIWGLARIDGVQGACITSQIMGAVPRINAIKAQLTWWSSHSPEFAKHLETLEALEKRTYEPQEKRNRIVHDVWLADDAANITVQFRAWPRKQLEYGIRDVDLNAIQSNLTAIAKLVTQAGRLRLDIAADVGAFLRKQPRQPASSPPQRGR